MNPFCQALKRFRGDMPVEELAKATGVAATTIYKMEQTAKVRWITVEKTYGRFFRDSHELCHTLILWALEQTDSKLELHEAQEVAANFLRDEARETGATAAKLSEAIEGLDPEDQAILVTFSRQYRGNEPTRRMARVWIEATTGAREAMGADRK